MVKRRKHRKLEAAQLMLKSFSSFGMQLFVASTELHSTALEYIINRFPNKLVRVKKIVTSLKYRRASCVLHYSVHLFFPVTLHADKNKNKPKPWV